MVNKGTSDHKPTNNSKVSVDVIRPPPRTLPRRDITDIFSNFPRRRSPVKLWYKHFFKETGVIGVIQGF